MKEIDVGHRTAEFAKENLSESETMIFRLKIKSFCVEVFQTLENHLKLSEPSVMQIWRALAVLRNHKKSTQTMDELSQKLNLIKILARLLPSIFSESDVQPLIEEWKLLSMAADVDELNQTWIKTISPNQRVDKYWLSVFGLKRYPLVVRLVRPCLTIQPHNAAEGRGFSVNASVVTKERNCLSLETLNGIRHMIFFFLNVVGIANFVITQDLIQSARTAGKRYKEFHSRIDNGSEPSAKIVICLNIKQIMFSCFR